MNARSLIPSIIICIISMIMILNGCATSQPSRFYVLNVPERPQMENSQACKNESIISIGINPIDLPRYLDRPQIMTRVNDNEYKLSELNLWAEPLKNSIPRIIAQNLNTLLCSDTVIFPRTGFKQFDYRLSAEVIRLDGTLGGQALLEVQWSIYDERAQKILITKNSRYSEPIRSQDYNALAYAYSRVLSAFSQETADTFKSISQGKSHP